MTAPAESWGRLSGDVPQRIGQKKERKDMHRASGSPYRRWWREASARPCRHKMHHMAAVGPGVRRPVQRAARGRDNCNKQQTELRCTSILHPPPPPMHLPNNKREHRRLPPRGRNKHHINLWGGVTATSLPPYQASSGAAASAATPPRNPYGGRVRTGTGDGLCVGYHPPHLSPAHTSGDPSRRYHSAWHPPQ